jgi:RNA polymerase sigma factor for flagellar operon FliA
MRRRAREVEATFLQIEQEKGVPATVEEVASRLNLSLPEFQTLLGELRGLTVMGFEEEEDEDSNIRTRQVQDDQASLPSTLFEQGEMRDKLAQAIDKLGERERQVVALYYLEELTMKEIGAVLGVTESRVSQIHTQAVIRLRAALSPLKAESAA